jgi:predicted amidophosphoribosyltransferase
MYCDACGTALQSEQTFCGKCGKEIRPGFSVAYPRPDRVREHVRLLLHLSPRIGEQTCSASRIAY